MITGAHLLLYSADPDADRAFFRDVLGFRSVDAGGGWLIFALPPSEAALHPDDEERRLAHGGHQLLGAVLYLMCDDLRAQVAALAARRVGCTGIEEEPWGLRTTIRLPSGGEIGLYQPTHPTPLAGRSSLTLDQRNADPAG
jgi:catechol 2,3-dioxygenase-like lactoylglutathione lyase family enzyme